MNKTKIASAFLIAMSEAKKTAMFAQIKSETEELIPITFNSDIPSSLITENSTCTND